MSALDGFSASSPMNENPNPNPTKRKRNLPGTPDAEVISLSPKSLMATNRFICELCNKGFQRDQNLQLHRRSHNLPWKLRHRTNKEVRKKVYVCPEKTCVHHEPSRALGDLTGIKKHFSRKHGEKKWKCDKCSKKYAVLSDWKAHGKICGTKEYICDCGTLFSRKDSYNTHRAFCDIKANESSRFNSNSKANQTFIQDLINGSFSVSSNPQQEQLISPFSHVLPQQNHVFLGEPADNIMANSHLLRSDGQKPKLPVWLDCSNYNSTHFSYPAANSLMGLQELVQSNTVMNMFGLSNPSAQPQNQYVSNISRPPLKWGPKEEDEEEEEERENLSQTMAYVYSNNQNDNQQISAHMSATALLQRAAQMGSTRPNPALNDAIFGSMTSSACPLSQVTAPISDPVEKFLNGQGDHGLMSQMSSSSASGSSLGDGLLVGDFNYSKPVLIPGSNFDHLMMINGSLNQSGKLKMGGNESEQMSLTRDFLGVGSDLSNELSKFDAHCNYLSQYSGGG